MNLSYDLHFSWTEFASAFVVLFAVIDILGSLPIIIDLRTKGRDLSAWRASLYSYVILLSFLFIGEAMLSLFNVDINSFAAAGSLIIFVMAMEMILGVELFRNDGPSNSATIIPLVFPLIAGAGTFTTLLSLRAEYNILNIILALTSNLLVVYLVITQAERVERIIGKGGVYVLKKFFGIILLAIAVRLFTANISTLLNHF
ncbi:MAG: MarC family protein [Bacteroidales bacterium]